MWETREEGGRVTVWDLAEGSGRADVDRGGGPQAGTTRCHQQLLSGRLLEPKKAAGRRTPSPAFQHHPPHPGHPTPCIRLPKVGELAQQGWAGRGPALEPRDKLGLQLADSSLTMTPVLVGVCWPKGDCPGADVHSLLIGPHPGSQGSLAFTGNCVLSPHTHPTELPRVILDGFLRKHCVKCYFKVFIKNKPLRPQQFKKMLISQRSSQNLTTLAPACCMAGLPASA